MPTFKKNLHVWWIFELESRLVPWRLQILNGWIWNPQRVIQWLFCRGKKQDKKPIIVEHHLIMKSNIQGNYNHIFIIQKSNIPFKRIITHGWKILHYSHSPLSLAPKVSTLSHDVQDIPDSYAAHMAWKRCHHVSPWCKQHGSEYVKKVWWWVTSQIMGCESWNSRLRRTALKLPATPVKHALYHLFSMALYHLVINSTSIKRINSKSVTSRLFFVLSSPLWLPWVAFIVPQKKLRNKLPTKS